MTSIGQVRLVVTMG